MEIRDRRLYRETQDRMAECVDAGRARGEIATRVEGPARRNDVRPQDIKPATLDTLGISRQRLHEARKLAPETVER